jgi:superfamily II DNA or RNA helicase
MSALLKYIQLKTSAILGDIKDGEIISSEAMLIVKIRELYPSYKSYVTDGRLGVDTFGEYALLLDEEEFVNLFDISVQGYAKELRKNKRFKDLLPPIVRKWNKWLLEDTDVEEIGFNLTKDELPMGSIAFNPVETSLEKEELTDFRGALRVFTNGSPAGFNEELENDYNLVGFSKKTNSLTAVNKNSIINVVIDPYEFYDKGGLGKFGEKIMMMRQKGYEPVLADNPNIDANYIKKVRDAIDYASDTSKFKYSFQNIDLLPLIYESQKASYASAKLKTSIENKIFFEIEFDKAEKIISVVPVMDWNYACKVIFQRGKGRANIYYDADNEKLILTDVANPELFAIIENSVGDVATYGRTELFIHQAGLSIRDKERLLKAKRIIPLSVPSELLKEKPLLSEMVMAQTELLALAENEKEKHKFYPDLIKKCTDYVNSYTTWEDDKDTGARVRVGIVDDKVKGKTNFEYIHSVEETFWNYNPKITVEELLAYFVSKGDSIPFRKLSQRIIGIDYYIFFDHLIDILIENKMLAIEDISLNLVSKSIEKLEYKYIHEYASGNVYKKKEALKTEVDRYGNIVIKGIDKDIYAYFGYDLGNIILENQQEILDDVTPTPCKIITAKEDKNKKLELSINNEIFFQPIKEGGEVVKITPIEIVTKTWNFSKTTAEHFEYFLRSGKTRILGGISQQEIIDAYVSPLHKGTFITRYILPNWKPKAINLGEREDSKGNPQPIIFKKTELAIWILTNEFGYDEEDFQKEDKRGKTRRMGLTEINTKVKKEERLRYEQVYQDIIAKYNEVVSKIQVEGNRLFDIFLRNEVTAGQQTRIEDLWNKTHNNYAHPNLDKIPIFVETSRYFGANVDTPFTLRQAQIGGIKNFVSRNNSHLLAHEVGFGKTTSAIATVTHLFNTGQASRVLIIVPNAVYPNWIKEIKGEGKERGIAPYLNIVELYNAKSDAIAKLKVLTEDDKSALVKFRTFRSKVDKYLKKKDYPQFEFDGNDISKLEKFLTEYIPNWSRINALYYDIKEEGETRRISIIDRIEKLRNEYLGIETERIGTQTESKAGITKRDKIEIRNELEKKFTSDVMTMIQQKERSLVDELGYYKPETLKPNSVILATHEALSELRAKTQYIEETIAFVDDVEEISYAGKSIQEWMDYLPNNPVPLEKLKIDAIIVDEVHNFNELVNKTRKRYLEEVPIRPRSREKELRYYYTTGFGGGGSRDQHLLKYNSTGDYTSADKLNLLSIVLEIQDNNRQKSDVTKVMNSMMLSGTPFTDTPFQMISVFALINLSILREYEMASAYKFFENFIVEEWKYDITHDDKYGLFAKIERYRNTIALSNFIKTFSDFKISDKVIDEARPKKFTIPDLENLIVGAEGVDSSVPLSKLQEEVKQTIADFVEGKISKKELCPFGSTAEMDVDTVSNEIVITEEEPETVKEGEAGEEGEEEDKETNEYDAESLVESENMNKEEGEKARALLGMRYQSKLVMSPYFFVCEGGAHMNLPPLKEYSKKEIKVKNEKGAIVSVAKYDLGAKNFVENSPKFLYVSECVKSVLDYHKEVRNGKDPDGIPSNQVIYLNTGRKFKYQGEEYSAFELIKRYIGEYRTDIDITTDEIGIIHGEIPIDERKNIQNEFNAGKLKLLIGSSAIREGVNLQKNSTVMYITQAEYAPAIAMQLEGRVWRQGNKWANVRIVYVLAFNSLDAFVYSKLTRKIHSIRTMLESGVYDMNKTQFTIDADEMKMHLITDPNRLATLKWQEEVEVNRSKLEEFTGIIDTLNSVKRKYPQVQKTYEDFLLKVNVMSEVLERVRLDDLYKEVRKEQGVPETDKKEEKEEKKVEKKGDKKTEKKKSKEELSDADIEKLIADGVYKKHYEHIQLDKDTNFAIFLQKLNIIKANYKNAKQYERVKDEVEEERQGKELPLEQTEGAPKKEKKKGKWETFHDTIVNVGYKNTDAFLAEADLFSEGGEYDIILGTYSTEVQSKGLNHSDLDNVITEYQEQADKIMDYLNDEKKNVQTLKKFFEDKIEERKKSGKFTLEEQVEKFKKTNSLIVLKSEVNA